MAWSLVIKNQYITYVPGVISRHMFFEGRLMKNKTFDNDN